MGKDSRIGRFSASAVTRAALRGGSSLGLGDAVESAAALHVVGAAAVDAPVHDLSTSGIALPVFNEPERHHVVVAVQDEALALARSGQPPDQHRHVS